MVLSYILSYDFSDSLILRGQNTSCGFQQQDAGVPPRSPKGSGRDSAARWGRSRPHIVPALVQSDRLWNVYRIKLSSFAGSAPVK